MLWDDSDWTYGYSEGVLPDVSNSEPATQPTTATGNGTGYYVDNSGFWSALNGTVQGALNYAIMRDQQKIAQQTGTMYTGPGNQVVATPQAVAQQQNSRLLLIGLLVVGAAFVLKGK